MQEIHVLPFQYFAIWNKFISWKKYVFYVYVNIKQIKYSVKVSDTILRFLQHDNDKDCSYTEYTKSNYVYHNGTLSK